MKSSSTTDIVDALVSKGVLTEEEGKLITKGHVSKQEKTPKVTEKDGAFKLESANGRNSIQLTGRVHFDARAIDGKGSYDTFANSIDRDSASLADNFELRRARIGVKGVLAKDFDYEILTNLVGSSANLVDVAYVNAGMVKPLQFRAGIFKQPFNLEEYGTSSNNIDFMERSYINQLSPAKKPGFMLHGVTDIGLNYAGSVYQQNGFGETDSNSTGKGFAGRTSMNFAQLAGSKDVVLHAGVAGFSSEYGVLPTSSSNGGYCGTSAACVETNGTVFSLRTEGRGLNNIYRAQIGGEAAKMGGSMPSNSAASVRNKAYGLEFAAAINNIKVQAEWMNSDFDAKQESTSNPAKLKAEVETGYVEALWLLTGEKYADWYKNGAWGGIKPKNEFDFEKGGLGAWEIGVRYDYFDIGGVSYSGTGSRIQGLKTTAADTGANTTTVGIKWQLNPNMRVLANYSHTKFDDAFLPVDLTGTGKTINKEDILMVRTQYNF